MIRRATVVFALCFLASAALAQEMPADYREVLQTLGRPGDFKAGVLKVNLPRNDLRVAVAGLPLPTPFGFGGWVVFTKGDAGMDVLMGDLVLLEDEVNPVMSLLLDNGIDVTALHNHFFWEQPRVYYMHVHAHSSAADIARRLKPALEKIPRPATPAASPAPPPPGQHALDAVRLTSIIREDCETLGPVLKFTVGRDDIALKEMGAAINARMGLNTWAAFYGTMEDAAVAGDVAMLEEEVTPVLKTLRAHGLDVVAIHHHMTGSRPVVIFLHYWGRGSAQTLATGVRAALNQTVARKRL